MKETDSSPSAKRKETRRKYWQSEKGKESRKRYLQSDKGKEAQRKSVRQHLDGWKKIILEKAICPGCGKVIFFNSKVRDNTIAFDHRKDGSEVIKGTPAKWLYCHLATPENIEIWESCDFGMLCHKCNRSLPTNNRVEWLQNMLKYATNKAG
jgi:hypothetical protein